MAALALTLTDQRFTEKLVETGKEFKNEMMNYLKKNPSANKRNSTASTS
jgi:hypothetical protein